MRGAEKLNHGCFELRYVTFLIAEPRSAPPINPHGTSSSFGRRSFWRLRYCDSVMKVESDKAIKMVALYEAAKGMLVLLAGGGLLGLIHRDVESIAVFVVRRLNLNPAHQYPHIFLDAAARVTDSRLWFFAAMALGYSLVRFVEAYGLWHRRPWAEWFAIFTGGIYMPAEIYELSIKVTKFRAIAFGANVLIVAYLAWVLWNSRRGARVELVPPLDVKAD